MEDRYISWVWPSHAMCLILVGINMGLVVWRTMTVVQIAGRGVDLYTFGWAIEAPPPNLEFTPPPRCGARPLPDLATSRVPLSFFFHIRVLHG